MNWLLKSLHNNAHTGIYNASLRVLEEDFQNCCAIYNLTFVPQYSDTSDAHLMVSEMRRKMNVANTLVNETSHLDTKRAGYFDLVDSLQVNFPFLSWRDIKLITCGTYQVRE